MKKYTLVSRKTGLPPIGKHDPNDIKRQWNGPRPHHPLARLAWDDGRLGRNFTNFCRKESMTDQLLKQPATN